MPWTQFVFVAFMSKASKVKSKQGIKILFSGAENFLYLYIYITKNTQLELILYNILLSYI